LIASLDSEQTGEAVAYEAPSEAEFAASVAKDMAGEALSSRRLWWIAGAVVVILIILLIVLLNQG
jgi:predicted cobalt transporter CbtA